MSALFDGLGEGERALLRPAAPPRHAQAMRATLTPARFSDPDWIFERKLDGIRCISVRAGDGVRLLSRNDLAMNDRYPELTQALAAERCDQFAIDGEIVAFDGPHTSFARLAARRRHWVAAYLYVFDILWLAGHDVRRLPLRARKRLLRSALDFHGPLRLTPHRNGDGEAYYRDACRRGWEGLIAKRADSPYSSARSRDWLKLKCEHGQELVVGGFTAPRGSREQLGALLLGYYRDGELVYAGKVGTGFDRATLNELGQMLGALARDNSPFVDPDDVPARGARWVRPQLVVEVGFSEWTRDGRLRHPRFLGLREDKPALEVVREA